MRRVSDVWEHWEEYMLEDGSRKVRCRYCNGKSQNRNATKCAEHTMKCRDRINAGVEFSPAPNASSAMARVGINVGASTSSAPYKPPFELSLPMAGKDSNNSNDSADLDGAGNSNNSFVAQRPGLSSSSGTSQHRLNRKRQALELISELLFDEGERDSAKKSNRVPLSEEEYKSEERDLRLNELRLRVRNLELKNQLLERLLPLSEKGYEALDKYLSYGVNDGHVHYTAEPLTLVLGSDQVASGSRDESPSKAHYKNSTQHD